MQTTAPVTDIAPEPFSQCPVCHHRFRQSPRGRTRTFCSDACRVKQFRYARRVTKLTETERKALVEKHLFVGDWQLLDRWPEWPEYHCLACTAPIGATTPAWYDRNDWDQINGVYRRHICTTCHPQRFN